MADRIVISTIHRPQWPRGERRIVDDSEPWVQHHLETGYLVDDYELSIDEVEIIDPVNQAPPEPEPPAKQRRKPARRKRASE